MDFESYEDDPTYYVNGIVMSNLLREDQIITNYIYLAKNIFDNLDSIWPWSSRKNGSYYKIDKVVQRPRVSALNPSRLYVTGLFEYGESTVHIREVMTLVDALGDIGGLTEIIFYFMVILMGPISYHSYILKLTQKLFTARTKKF